MKDFIIPIDYNFIKCIKSKGSASILEEDRIYSTKTNINKLMYVLEEVKKGCWNSDRFKILKMPDIKFIENFIK
jgi:hypothetical protein